MRRHLLALAISLTAASAHADYLGSWKIDDTLTFAATTHSASTGAATDADSAPSYRIYEDETGTPILTGSMALLDDANTTGLYSEQVTLSAANGLEKGKTYTIVVGATVGSVAANTTHTFQIEAEVDANTVTDATVAGSKTAIDDAMGVGWEAGDHSLEAIGDAIVAQNGVSGTVTTGSTATVINVTSPAITGNEYEGSFLTFAADTTTAELRGQSRTIIATSDASPDTIEVYPALSTAPAPTDTFQIYSGDGGRPNTGDAYANQPPNFASTDIALDGTVNVGRWQSVNVAVSSTTQKPQVDVDSIDDDATAAQNAKLDYNGTGYAKANSTVATVTTLTGHTPQTADHTAAIAAVDNFVDDLETRLSAARAGYLDNLNGHTAQTGDNFTRLGAPVGASLSADLQAVEAQTDDIGVAGAGLSAVPYNAAWDASINAQADLALTDYDAPTYDETEGFFQLALRSDAAIGTDRAALLTALNADEGSGAGGYGNQTDALQGIREEGDANWGSTGENPNVINTSEIASVTSQTEIVLADGATFDDAYNSQTIVLYDDSASDFPSVRVVADYVGSTKTVTLDSAPDFTVGADDSVRIFATAPGTSAPTADQNAIALLNRALSGHTTAGTVGRLLNDWVDGERLDLILDAVVADTNELQQDDYPTTLATLATSAALATVDGNVDLILADTGELQADWANGGRLDLILDQAAAGGAGLTKAEVREALFEDAYDLAASASDGSALGRILDGDTDATFDWVQSDDSLQGISEGAGGAGPSASAIADAVLQEAVGDHSATAGSLAEHVSAILADTNELQTDDVPSLIAALPTDADVNAQADQALLDYDAPTRTEATADKDEVMAKLLAYFQLALRKDAAIETDNQTELDAINADGGSGAGSYAATLNSNEAIRDRGDAAWTTGGGGAGEADNRDLSVAGRPNQWELVQRAGGVTSVNTVTIYQGETKKVSFDLSNILGPGDVMTSMDDTPTATSGDLTVTKVGIGPTWANVDVAAAAGATTGEFIVKETVTTQNEDGPLTLIGKIRIVDDPAN